MNKLSVVRPLDLTFLVPAIISTVITMYGYFNGLRGEPLALLIVLSIVFASVFLAFVAYRWKFVSTITYTTKHNLHVITNGFPALKDDVENVTTSTINSWNFALSKINYPKKYQTMCENAINDLFVVFKEFPIKHDRLGKLAGFAMGDAVVVGYKEDLDNTALAHELGHFIFKKYSGIFDNETCHAFMKTHGLQ